MDAFVEGLRENGYSGITFAQANVLGYLDRDRGVRQTLIAERAGLTKQAVGQFVDELVKAGLVERFPDPEDGRARLIRYTQHGRDFLTVADRIKEKIENSYGDALGGGELDQLKSLLARLVDPDPGGHKAR
ncbi:MAG: MarR family transcriptional regulator [Proteobacteria bacterium]|nr:MarR family transcriptional regulator [Pseudomonadota bacterium]